MFKKIIRFVTSNKFILITTFLINIAIFLAVIFFINTLPYYFLLSFIAFVTAFIVLLTSKEELVYKWSWILIFLFFPIYGMAFYILLKTSHGTVKQRKQWEEIQNSMEGFLYQDADVLNEVIASDGRQGAQSVFLLNKANMPVYKSGGAEYFSDGASYFTALAEELRKAEEFIFMEFFIIKPGRLWNEIVEILKEKGESGVEIKLLFDDFGCIDRFPKNYFKKLKDYNITAVPFNRIKPTINPFINYRSHRKIVVIDGKTAFTGGVNIGDEYVNLESPFGYWKDTGIMVKGGAVYSLAVLFCNNWRLGTKHTIDLKNYRFDRGECCEGYLQPYGSSPLHTEPLARNNLLRLIGGAEKYFYVTTPYLIIDNNIAATLKLAAASGIDVRIVMPGVPDKKLVNILSKSYYRDLLEGGVKIYEYKPGFIHAKLALCDGIIASVGTVNFDFRSLFLHFEDGVMLYSCEAIKDIFRDFENIFEESCQITMDDVNKTGFFKRVLGKILRIFAPLM